MRFCLDTPSSARMYIVGFGVTDGAPFRIQYRRHTATCTHTLWRDRVGSIGAHAPETHTALCRTRPIIISVYNFCTNFCECTKSAFANQATVSPAASS